jgi:hypothetical protein
MFNDFLACGRDDAVLDVDTESEADAEVHREPFAMDEAGYNRLQNHFRSRGHSVEITDLGTDEGGVLTLVLFIG